ALALARRALALKETAEVRALFVQCVKQLGEAEFDDDLRRLLARALSEGWSRPSELSALAGELAIRQGARAPAEAANDPLLRALLESAPVRTVELERSLTAARTELVCRATSAHSSGDGRQLTFFCALARQCFINEYVFACDADEVAQVQA